MRRISSARLFYISFLSFLLMGCFCIFGCKNPFKTRNSPPPEFSEGTWETPGLPEIVIQNLLYAYNEKIIGNFIQCLSDSFRFSAREDSINAVDKGRAELFANWDRSVEISVTTSIFNTSRQHPDSFGYVVSFLSTHPSDEVDGTLAVLSRDYELLIFDLKAAPPETTLAKGTATFHMRQTSFSWWSIYFWSDIPAESGEDDWADFKAKFRQ